LERGALVERLQQATALLEEIPLGPMVQIQSRERLVQRLRQTTIH